MGKRNWSLLLGCLVFGWSYSQSVDVWPGDANNNGIANHHDLLFIAANHGLTGTPRNNVSSVWAAQPLSILWGQGSPALPDAGYADCDGDGFVGATDYAALQQNYALTWSAGPFVDGSSLVANGAAPLTLNFGIDSVTVSGNTTFSLQISLGDSIFPVDSILGLAFVVRYDTNVIDSMAGFTPGQMFASDTSFAFSFRDVRSQGELQISIARTNRINISGAGLVGTVVVALDDNIRVASNFDCPMAVGSAFGITAKGFPVDMVAVNDTMVILTQLHEGEDASLLKVFPNPAGNELHVMYTGLGNAEVSICDLRGVVLATHKVAAVNAFSLNTTAWPDGMYILELRTPKGIHRGRFLVRHAE